MANLPDCCISVNNDDTPPPRILTKTEVMIRVGLSSSSLYRRELAGTFPRRIQLGGARMGWIESEVDDWIATRPRGPVPRGSKAVAP